jgi:hypothetical protein
MSNKIQAVVWDKNLDDLNYGQTVMVDAVVAQKTFNAPLNMPVWVWVWASGSKRNPHLVSVGSLFLGSFNYNEGLERMR